MIHVTTLSEGSTDIEIEQAAFEAFVSMHPHEAYEHHRDRFLAVMKRRAPQLSEEQIVALLKETEEES